MSEGIGRDIVQGFAIGASAGIASLAGQLVVANVDPTSGAAPRMAVGLVAAAAGAAIGGSLVGKPPVRSILAGAGGAIAGSGTMLIAGTTTGTGLLLGFAVQTIVTGMIA